MTTRYSPEKESYREPPNGLSITLAAPNSSGQKTNVSPHPGISTSSNEEDSPNSFTSSSSAAYSSIGNGIRSSADGISRMRTLRPNFTRNGLTDDDEFIAGHGLLSEVLKMQSLLEEYQQALTVLEIEKADKQQEINKLDKLLKGKAETEERYKDEIWKLEINSQDLLQKINELSQHLSKSTTEQTRLVQEEIKLNQELEQLKAVRHTWETETQQSQDQHEQEVTRFKKLLHTLRIEKDDVSKQLEELINQQHNESIQTTTLRHLESICEHTNDVEKPNLNQPVSNESTNTNHTERGTVKAINHHYEVEMDTLRMSLEQAHEIIKSMQNTIDKEREEHLEVSQLLREAQETIENFYNQQESNKTLPESASSSRSASPLVSKNPQLKALGKINKRSSVQPPFSRCASSLCDELSRAGSTTTFLNVSTESLNNTESSALHKNNLHLPNVNDLQRDISFGNLGYVQQTHAVIDDKLETPILNNSDINNMEITDKDIDISELTSSLEKQAVISEKNSQHHQENTINVQLSTVNLPPICNLDDFKSDDEGETTKELPKAQSNQEFYGSLTVDPKSYIYNSQRSDKIESKTFKKTKQFSPVKMSFSDALIDTKLIKHTESDTDDCGENSIKAMTRAMIGDWMWKYTKRVVGFGKFESKHRRFFWIHPYSQTLYWNTKEPGTEACQSGTKSVIVESFRLLDKSSERNKPPCILVQTPSKGMQIQCLDFNAHYAWMRALYHLLKDNTITQKILPTKMLPESGKMILDSHKLLSFRKSTQLPEVVMQPLEKDNDNEPVNSCNYSEPISTVFNNSTLINLSFDDNFQKQALLDFAAIK